MPQKRVVRVISYEGIDRWVDAVLRNSHVGPRVIFDRRGTIKELQRIELGEGEHIVISLIAGPSK